MAARPRGQLALALALATVLLALLHTLPRLAADAAPTDLFVLPGGSGDACSQSAPCTLAAAGDSLFLGAGRYTGNGGAVITVTSGISLLCGWDGAAAGRVRRDPGTIKSIIDGQDQRRCLYMYLAVPLTVDGCVPEHGLAADAPWRGSGGGMRLAGDQCGSAGGSHVGHRR